MNGGTGMENFMSWAVPNLPFLCVIALLIVRIVVSVKRGLVKEICSCIATILASIAVLLIAFAVRKYFDEDRIILVITLILLFLLGIIYKIIDTFLTTLKLVSKLPVISLVDKILGIVIGVAEVVVVVWAVYCIIMIMDAGAFEEWVMNCVRNNKIMKTLFEYNYMYSIVANFSDKISQADIISKLGM